MKKTRLLSFSLAIVLVLSIVMGTVFMTAFAETTAVAKVGNTEYNTIDEAVANWTNNTTLTLLADVTLTDTIKLTSADHHTLNLDKYVLTAPSGKHAIEIVPGATPVGTTERERFVVNAAEGGGIVAIGKSCIYYVNANKVSDRLGIVINGGTFTGSKTINVLTDKPNIIGLAPSGVGGQSAPVVRINGGTFNGSLHLQKAMAFITGGVFHNGISAYGDSTAYRLISGGRFKSFSGTADAATKFAIGSAKNVYDCYVFIDDEGYTNVVPMSDYSDVDDFITTHGLQANISGAYPNSYLAYSSAASVGTFYTDANVALTKYNGISSLNKDIVFYQQGLIEEIQLKTSLTVDVANGEILPANKVVLTHQNAKFAISYKQSESPFEGENPLVVESGLVTHELVCEETTPLADGEDQIVNRVYSLNKLPVYAKIGSAEYPSLATAVQAAQAGQTVTVLDNISENGLVIDKNITIDLNGFTYTIDGTVGSAGTETNGLQLLNGANIAIKNGTITSSTAKILIQNYSNLTLTNVTLDGGNLQGELPYTLSNNSGATAINNTTIIASANGVAFDVCDYASYVAPTVAMTNSTIIGIIEVTDTNGGEFAGSLTAGANAHTELGRYMQAGDDVVFVHDYNFSLNISENNIPANDTITVEVVIDKAYYSLDYTFEYDNTLFSCAEDTDNDGVIEVKCLTQGTSATTLASAGVLATYTLIALNDIDKLTTTSISVEGAVIEYAIQALNTITNKVTGDAQDVTISLDCEIETKTDYVTGYTLVIVEGQDAGYAYDGQKMFYVEGYQAFAILVEGAVEVETINELLTKTTDCQTVAKSNDVNVEYVLDGKVDIKDATAVYACYSLSYEVSDYMELFLRADVNDDYRVDYADVNEVTDNYTE